MIRTLRPTDLVGLALFTRQAFDSEITSHTWPKVQPESGHLPINQVLWQTLGRSANHGRAWVAKDDGKVVGLAVARARCRGLVWDVEHLHGQDGTDSGLTELLERLCAEAASSGARRVFLEMPSGPVGSEVARRAGFERYTTSEIYRLDPPFKIPTGDFFEGRPRLRVDEEALYQLYNTAVPAVVRSAEAMTYEEWSALHRGAKGWAPSLIGDRHQYVWELGEGLAGWLEVVYGQKSQFLELMIAPKYETLLDRFIGYGLKQVSEKASVYSAVREYQAGLSGALERSGFKLAGSHDIYVRQLTVRIPESALVPAKITGG